MPNATSTSPDVPAARPWAHDTVLYQIYPRSFCDSTGDGCGDLRGIRSRLDYLRWLGVEAIWMNPTFPSPLVDGGYDVADFTGVHPDLGTVDDMRSLCADAHRRGIRVLLDLVANHSSDQHPWFRRALADPASPERRYYTFAHGRPGGRPPNNWLSRFGGPAWTRDERSRQWYLHSFAPQQPDLDHRNPLVQAEFERIFDFWYRQGVDGFRIDVVYGLVRDRALVDNPPARPGDPAEWLRLGQRLVGNLNQPDAHEILRAWHAQAARQTPPRMLLGETPGVADPAAFYGTAAAPEMDLSLGFPLRYVPFDADQLRGVIERVESQTPPHAVPTWEISTHDEPRVATRWGGGDERVARAALVLCLTLRGVPCLYYGDELAMPDVPVPLEVARDRARLRDDEPPRDPARTPMRWERRPGWGFTTPAATPWLPIGEGTCVADQEADPSSALHLTRRLVALRKATPAIRHGDQQLLDAPDGVLAYRRGAQVTVAVNTTGRPRAVAGLEGRVLASSDPARPVGHRAAGQLAAFEALVTQA